MTLLSGKGHCKTTARWREPDARLAARRAQGRQRGWQGLCHVTRSLSISFVQSDPDTCVRAC